MGRTFWSRLVATGCRTQLLLVALCSTVVAAAEANRSCGAANPWVRVPAGQLMLPTGPVMVDAFYLDSTEVTRARFQAFVEETGYRTTAERTDPDAATPWGSAVFRRPTFDNPSWWAFRPQAHWRSPFGEAQPQPISEAPNEPVVHMSYEDAERFARWAGGRLPSATEWEYAARAGTPPEAKRLFRAPPKASVANTWQGLFPFNNSAEDGYEGLAPVGCFPANAFGLHDMVGNSWEWLARDAQRLAPGMGLLAGGSFLCAPNFCQNYSPLGRQLQELSFSANHIGFRVAYDLRPQSSANAGDTITDRAR